MTEIKVLSQETIDKIAAGEVIERPASVVKELVENAIDAKSTAITVEIKEGGISFIRITDNGCGIPLDQVKLAFLRHSTSKIKTADDLLTISSLGFRGEALSSISAVAQVELITKTRTQITGTRYVIEGGIEKRLEEIGAPEGTTFLIRNLFFNTPARKKFLKTATTEGGYIQDLMERLALSHPDISFKFINNNQTKLQTLGNDNIKDIIYQIYGREIASNLIPIDFQTEQVQVRGFIGKPIVSRGNRQYENYFINGRYVKSSIVSKAIEQAYKSFLMQHKYPFTVLLVHFDGRELDVNVHPTKMELRFSNSEKVFQLFYQIINEGLHHKDLIPKMQVEDDTKNPVKSNVPKNQVKAPEPFEKRRIEMEQHQKENQSYNPVKSAPSFVKESSSYHAFKQKSDDFKEINTTKEKSNLNETVHHTVEDGSTNTGSHTVTNNGKADENKPLQNSSTIAHNNSLQSNSTIADNKSLQSSSTIADNKPLQINSTKVEKQPSQIDGTNAEKQPLETKQTLVENNTTDNHESVNQQEIGQMTLFQEDLLSHQSKIDYQIIGQVFDTYWIVQSEGSMFIIDQHAAHEKILYERTMKQLEQKDFTSQLLSPPIILTLSDLESSLLNKYLDSFLTLGFQIESFGGKEYAIRAVPANLYNLNAKQLFLDMLDGLNQDIGRVQPDMITEKIASMSCKAAVKGNQHLSLREAQELIKELMTLDNPYHCPHGRPVIVSMTKTELEKKFKRIV